MNKLLQVSQAIPRWVIKVVDFLIVGCAFALSYFIVYHFRFTNIIRGFFFINVFTYSIVAIIVMHMVRVHKGLIRYSNLRDILRIFTAVFCSSVAFLIITHTLVSYYFPESKTIAINSIILVNAFVSGMFLIMFRVSVKGAFFYIRSIHHAGKREPILVFGSDHNSILLKNALWANEKDRFEVVGFIDNDPKKVSKEIQQTAVYSVNSLEKLKLKRQVEKLVIINEHLEDAEKQETINRCLALGIQVLTVPPSEEWLTDNPVSRQIKDLRIEDLLQRDEIKIDNEKISEDIRGKSVLVTGAAGSIGSEIVRQVMKYNPAVLILCDQAESPLYEIQTELSEKFPGEELIAFIGDVRNHHRMEKLFSIHRPDVVFHAAAYKHVPMMEDNPYEAITTNVLGTKNIADLSTYYRVKKFVMVSTDKAVNPSNIMGASKRIAEIYIQALSETQENSKKGTCFITTRFGNVLGSNGSVIPRFRSQIEKGGPITVTHPEITRYFMTIPEAVQLVLEAGIMGEGGEIFIFDMGKPVKIVDLARNMIKLAGLQPEKDIKIKFTGLRPGEKLYEELLNDGESTKPTYHSKIKISEVIRYPFSEVVTNIDELIATTKKHDILALVSKMKEIVPEFVSMNSKFEELDKSQIVA
jgi:FlaA1/EpsC-like NDP-sugar epimerase